MFEVQLNQNNKNKIYGKLNIRPKFMDFLKCEN